MGKYVIDYGNEAGFRKEAVRCRRLAAGVADSLTSERLGNLAIEYDRRAETLRLQGQVDLSNKLTTRG